MSGDIDDDAIPAAVAPDNSALQGDWGSLSALDGVPDNPTAQPGSNALPGIASVDPSFVPSLATNPLEYDLAGLPMQPNLVSNPIAPGNFGLLPDDGANSTGSANLQLASAPITVWTPEGPMLMPAPPIAPQPDPFGRSPGAGPSVGTFDQGQPSRPPLNLPRPNFDGYFETPLMKGIRNVPETLGDWLFSEKPDDTSKESPESSDDAESDQSATPLIEPDKQGKHQPGHKNFQPGKSELTDPDPQALVDQFAGKGEPVPGPPVGEPGSKERVDFGKIIGHFVDKQGNRTPTTKGMIVYSRNGVHIYPARP